MPESPSQNPQGKLNRRQALRLSAMAGAVFLAGLPRTASARKSGPPHADRPGHAVSRFMKSMNCSQAVLETYAPEMGMSVEEARRVAAAFAGGMGMGSECGAVTGAFMVIGLKHGKTRDKDGIADSGTFSRVAEFVKDFKARHGSIGCSQLLGTDMGTPEGLKEAEKKGLFTSACPHYVRSASEILDRILA